MLLESDLREANGGSPVLATLDAVGIADRHGLPQRVLFSWRDLAARNKPEYLVRYMSQLFWDEPAFGIFDHTYPIPVYLRLVNVKDG